MANNFSESLGGENDKVAPRGGKDCLIPLVPFRRLMSSAKSGQFSPAGAQRSTIVFCGLNCIFRGGTEIMLLFPVDFPRYHYTSSS